jgi:CheY-like chemotaxis protein
MHSSKILVIDDDPFIRESVQKTLTKEGFEVETVASIRSAVDTVAKQHFQLILCDVMIPSVGGFELIEQIKADPSRKNIPILLVTGMDKEILHMTHHEADGVLTKPFNSEELVRKVKEMLSMQAQQH